KPAHTNVQSMMVPGIWVHQSQLRSSDLEYEPPLPYRVRHRRATGGADAFLCVSKNNMGGSRNGIAHRGRTFKLMCCGGVRLHNRRGGFGRMRTCGSLVRKRP